MDTTKAFSEGYNRVCTCFEKPGYVAGQPCCCCDDGYGFLSTGLGSQRYLSNLRYENSNLLPENEALRRKIMELEVLNMRRPCDTPDELRVLKAENNHFRDLTYSRLAEVEYWKKMYTNERNNSDARLEALRREYEDRFNAELQKLKLTPSPKPVTIAFQSSKEFTDLKIVTDNLRQENELLKQQLALANRNLQEYQLRVQEACKDEISKILKRDYDYMQLMNNDILKLEQQIKDQNDVILQLKAAATRPVVTPMVNPQSVFLAPPAPVKPSTLTTSVLPPQGLPPRPVATAAAASVIPTTLSGVPNFASTHFSGTTFGNPALGNQSILEYVAVPRPAVSQNPSMSTNNANNDMSTIQRLREENRKLGEAVSQIKEDRDQMFDLYRNSQIDQKVGTSQVPIQMVTSAKVSPPKPSSVAGRSSIQIPELRNVSPSSSKLAYKEPILIQTRVPRDPNEPELKPRDMFAGGTGFASELQA